MKEVALQKRGKTLVPFSEEDLEALREYKENQVLRAKLSGAEKPRSYQQLKMYWSCCRTVAENLEGVTKDDVDFEVKIQVAKKHPSMIRRFHSVQGVVYMEPISIAFHNMKHLEANNFFNQAWPIMAQMIGVTTDELLANANQ
jgi:hypothetical protein